jgi:YVTN family beta-propeller protein
MNRTASLLCLALLTPLAARAQTTHASGPQYRVLQSIALPATAGWDYLTRDAAHAHLFITRDNHVQVVDPANGALLTDLTGMQHVHGVALAGPRAYISDGGANSVIVIDRVKLKTLGSIAVGQGPDGILYDPYSRRVFAFDGRGNDATVIDASDSKVVGHVPLEGKPEAAAADGRGHLFVNIESANAIAVINTRTLRVTARWSLSPCDSPSGIALDIAHRRLFSGCDNKLLAVSDTQAGRLVTTVPIGAGVDADRFDSARQLIFSSNGLDGTLTVIRELAPDRYEVVQNVPTMLSARTMELDPTTHRLYLVGAQLQPVVPATGGGRQRRSMVPGTFRLLIVGQ